MKFARIIERKNENLALSRIFDAWDNAGNRYLIKRSDAACGQDEWDVLDWIFQNKPKGLLVPLQIKLRLDGTSEEIYPYVRHPTLFHYLRQSEIYSTHEISSEQTKNAIKITSQISAAVGIMNSNGFIHADARSNNIFIKPSTLETTVFDYNISGRPYTLNSTDTLMDDPAFPPEFQQTNSHIGFAYDVYQVAYILKQMTYVHEQGKSALSTPKKGLPQEVVQLISKSTHTLPSERFPDCNALNYALRSLTTP